MTEPVLVPGLVALVDPVTGRFSDSLAPPSVAANTATAAAAATAAASAKTAAETASSAAVAAKAAAETAAASAAAVTLDAVTVDNLGQATTFGKSLVKTNDAIAAREALGALSRGSTINVADYPSAVAAVAAASAGMTVVFPAGIYVNPVGVGNGITVMADNVTLDFSPGAEIQVPTWGQPGIDAYNRSGVVVRGNPTIRYTGTRGTHTGGNIRGSAIYCNTAGFYTNKDRCTVESMRTIGMVCGVFFSSYNGTSSTDRVGVGNVIGRLECEDYNFGVLFVGQNALRIDDIYCNGDLDDSSGTNPTHAYYCSASSSFRATNVTIGKAICENNISGHAFQAKYVDALKLGPHTAKNCLGLLSIIDCVDMDAPSMTITQSLTSPLVPEGSIMAQGTGSKRLNLKATVVQDTVAGVDQRAAMVIASDSTLDFTIVSNRTSNASASSPEVNVRGQNNRVAVDIRNVSAFPAVAVRIGDGTIDSTGTEVTLRRIAGCLRGIDWAGPAGGNVHYTRSNVSLTSVLNNTISGTPVYSVFEDGTLAAAGTPQGVVTAPVGALFKRTDGTVGTTLYLKESGTGNTGWRPMAPSADIQTFTANGTWTKPAGARVVSVALVGGGGGGGSGARNAAGTARSGGGGGGGGAVTTMTFDASLLGATEPIIVGAAGTGAAAQTADATAGNSGGNGGSTYFGIHTAARNGAGGGGGGLAVAGTGGTAGTGGSAGGAGGAGSAVGAAGASGALGAGGAPGGGAGGGLTTANAEVAGAVGNFPASAVRTAGTAGAIGGGNGGAGSAATTGTASPGGSGGGGGSSASTTGGAGGAGGSYGAGGGGGGASANGQASGAGGAAGAGLVVVVTTF